MRWNFISCFLHAIQLFLRLHLDTQGVRHGKQITLQVVRVSLRVTRCFFRLFVMQICYVNAITSLATTCDRRTQSRWLRYRNTLLLPKHSMRRKHTWQTLGRHVHHIFQHWIDQLEGAKSSIIVVSSIMQAVPCLRGKRNQLTFCFLTYSFISFTIRHP